MPVARPEPSEVRVIAHVDLDCFYVQVEQRKHPELRGKPTGVVQYNPWKGGGLIAVGYEARKFGVTRNMRGDEAKKVCPDIELIQVPVAHGKADLTQYRDAGSEVVEVLARKGTCERASIDEVYLDITEASAALSLQEAFSEEVLKSHILGHSEVAGEQSSVVKQWLLKNEADPKDHMLARGAVVIADLRMAVLTETGFTCSAGIAHNKMLAKLASGMHKPAQQTLVPSSAVTALLATLPIKKMKQLGGKLGDSLQDDLQISFVGDLLQFSESRLQDLYGVNTGTWLWNTARGLSGDEVKARTLPKSHSCGKTFPGPKALKSLEDVRHWIMELATELQERLDVDFQLNHRMAHHLTMHAGTNHGYKANQDQKFPSKSCVLRYGKEKIASDAFRLFERGLNDYLGQYSVSPKRKGVSGAWAITSLFIGASNILATPAGVNPITRFFSSPTSPPTNFLQENAGPSSPSSASSILSLDAPLPTYRSPDVDDEITCELHHNLDTRRFNIRSESHMLVPPPDKQSEQSMAKPMKTWLSFDSYCIPQKGVDDDVHGQIGEEPASDTGLGSPGGSTMDVQESDIECTPRFGQFGHVNTPDCTLQLPASGPDMCEVDLLSVNSELDPRQNSSEAPQFIIDCSPVEHEAPILCVVAFEEKTHKDTHENSNTSQRCDVPKHAIEHEAIDTVGSESPFGVYGKEPQPCSSAAGSRQQVSGFLKLKDVWDRKGLSASQCARSTPPDDNPLWGYKQGEIDEAVLAELPEEIQEELCRSLGFKRPRMVKKSTIGDFFNNTTSHRGNKADP
eukprot:c7805_g1_i1 orf=558-2945(-)